MINKKINHHDRELNIINLKFALHYLIYICKGFVIIYKCCYKNIYLEGVKCEVKKNSNSYFMLINNFN